MAKMRVPERGSEEERRYYLTKEGLKDFDSYKEFDWRRALELLFEDAPDVTGGIAAQTILRSFVTKE